jgi:hypothetical protein
MVKSYNLLKINDFTYSLKINGDYVDNLYNVIKKMLKSCHLDYETNSIFFSAENVTTFKKYILDKKNNRLSHVECIKLIDDLSKQILYLNTKGLGFYGFDISDILTIDNTFIFCSTECLLQLNNESIIFTSPIKYIYFSNPEILKLTSLPHEINYKCCYYSLGSLVVFSLLNTNLLVGNELKSSEEIDKIIMPLYNTKIYWFLKRCLNDDINNRKLLLV